MNADQERGRRAFAFVQGYPGDHADLLGLARALPVMLRTNGLLATWAHLLKKEKPEHAAAAGALLAHLRALSLVPPEGSAVKVFLDCWTAPAGGASGLQLRRLTAEAVAFSVWLKRAAEALLDDGTPPASAGASLP